MNLDESAVYNTLIIRPTAVGGKSDLFIQSRLVISIINAVFLLVVMAGNGTSRNQARENVTIAIIVIIPLTSKPAILLLWMLLLSK